MLDADLLTFHVGLISLSGEKNAQNLERDTHKFAIC